MSETWARLIQLEEDVAKLQAMFMELVKVVPLMQHREMLAEPDNSEHIAQLEALLMDGVKEREDRTL